MYQSSNNPTDCIYNSIGWWEGKKNASLLLPSTERVLLCDNILTSYLEILSLYNFNCCFILIVTFKFMRRWLIPVVATSCQRCVCASLCVYTCSHICSIVAALMIPQLPSVIFVWCLLWGNCGWILWSFCEQSFKEIRCWNPSITHNIRPGCLIDYSFMFSFILCVCNVVCWCTHGHTSPQPPRLHTLTTSSLMRWCNCQNNACVCVKGEFDDKPWLRTDGTLAGSLTASLLVCQSLRTCHERNPRSSHTHTCLFLTNVTSSAGEINLTNADLIAEGKETLYPV